MLIYLLEVLHVKVFLLQEKWILTMYAANLFGVI